MTSLKFHFDDGSEYLAHYGKVGMHWGEWNEETQAKYAANPDLIGEFAKMLTQGGATVNNNLQNIADDSGRAINEFSRQARNTAVNISKEAQTAVRRGLHDASVMASHAQRALSSVASTALENGKKFVDSIFGTTFSRQSQANAARRRRHESDKQEDLAAKRVKASATRSKRAHEEGLAAANSKDKAKRERAMTAYKTQHKTTPKSSKTALRDLYRKKSGTGMTSEQYAQYKKERARAYKEELTNNKIEALSGGKKYYKKDLKDMNRRTNAYYGRLGKDAQRTEVQRRRRILDSSEAYQRRTGRSAALHKTKKGNWFQYRTGRLPNEYVKYSIYKKN